MFFLVSEVDSSYVGLISPLWPTAGCRLLYQLLIVLLVGRSSTSETIPSILGKVKSSNQGKCTTDGSDCRTHWRLINPALSVEGGPRCWAVVNQLPASINQGLRQHNGYRWPPSQQTSSICGRKQQQLLSTKNQSPMVNHSPWFHHYSSLLLVHDLTIINE